MRSLEIAMDVHPSDRIGELVFDSWSNDGPELRRRRHENRHLIYEGDGVILDLLLKGTRKGVCEVSGHVLPSKKAPGTASNLIVHIEQGNYHCFTHTNRLGEFIFEGVPNRKFDLGIILPDARFMIRGLSNENLHASRVKSSRSGKSVVQ
jgi:hypothetical protein